MSSDTAFRERPNVSPLSPEQLDGFRADLLDRREAVMKTIADLSETARRTLADQLGQLSHLPQHLGELASEVFEQSMALDFLARAEEEMHAIDDALERIDLRSYGTCDGCREPIPPARLTAIPEARLCFECKLESER